MSVSGLTVSTQNYLKAIWGLQEWSEDPVTASSIAARTGLRLSTVSGAIGKLAEDGLVEHAPYGSVALTDAGRQHALGMVRRHRLIETFLVNVLEYRWDEVHDEAETLEHAVSDLMIDRIDALLGQPARDPHGDPIPAADGTVRFPEAVTLSGVEPGSVVRVERVSDDDPEMLRYFAGQGIGVGAVLRVEPGAPYSESLDVVVESSGAGGDADSDDTDPAPTAAAGASTVRLALGRSATEAIWVSLR